MPVRKKDAGTGKRLNRKMRRLERTKKGGAKIQQPFYSLFNMNLTSKLPKSYIPKHINYVPL